MTEAQALERRRWIALALLASPSSSSSSTPRSSTSPCRRSATALDFSQDNLAWVVNAYVLTFGGFLLLGGRIADLLGRRRVFMGGLVLFALASLAGGLATNEGQLIAARAVQGLGAAILSPAALSIVTTTFRDGAERNKALGVWGAVAGAGGAAGVLLGGVLTDSLGWEWVLWVNVPIGIGAAALAPTLIAESRSESETRHFDFAGAVTVTAGLSLLVYALVDADDAGWGSTQTIGLLGVSAALLGRLRRDRAALDVAAGAVRDLPHADADRRQRRRPADRRVAVLDVLLHLALHAAGARLQRDQGRALLPAAGADDHRLGRGRLAAVTRIGFKPVLAAGMVFIAAGLLWFSQVSVGGGLPDRHPRPLAAGRGRARLRLRPSTIAAVSGVEDHEAGLASGLINTSQQVGGALGLAVLATIANSGTGDLRRRGPARAHRGLPGGLPRRRRVRGARPRRDADPDPRPRQPRPRRDRPAEAAAARRPGRPRPRGPSAAAPSTPGWPEPRARRARRSRRRRSARTSCGSGRGSPMRRSAPGPAPSRSAAGARSARGCGRDRRPRSLDLEGADQRLDLGGVLDVPVGMGDDGDAAGLVDQLHGLLGGRPAPRHEGLGAGHQVLLEESAHSLAGAGGPSDVGAADRERVAGLGDRVLEREVEAEGAQPLDDLPGAADPLLLGALAGRSDRVEVDPVAETWRSSAYSCTQDISTAGTSSSQAARRRSPPRARRRRHRGR